MALNAATAAWIRRTLGGLLRGELPAPLRLFARKQSIETEGTEAPPAPEANEAPEAKG